MYERSVISPFFIFIPSEVLGFQDSFWKVPFLLASSTTTVSTSFTSPISAAKVSVGFRNEEQRKAATQTVTFLRNHGINADFYTVPNAKKFFKYVGDMGIPFTIFKAETGYTVKKILADGADPDKERAFDLQKEALDYLSSLLAAHPV